jgi:hypothetical protein
MKATAFSIESGSRAATPHMIAVFAVLLKAFQFEERFPDRRDDVTGTIATHLARQAGVSPEAYL